MSAQEESARAERAATPELLAIAHEEFTVTLTGIEAWCALALLQLALRHPAIGGETARHATAAARRLQDAVAPEGGLAELAEMGWNPAYDAPPHAGRCRACGCTDDRACIGPGGEPCHWIEPDLCSACDGRPEPVQVQ